MTPTPVTSIPEEKRCIKTLANGRQCGSPRMNGSEYCFQHCMDPEIVEYRTESRKRGGKNQVTDNLDDWKTINVRSLDDLRRLLSKCLNLTASGRMHPKISNALAQLAAQVNRTFEIIELEERLQKILDRLEA